VTLKWPNDALINGKKVCGILAEALWLGDDLRAIILGIGLNIRVDFSQTDLADVATSVEPELGRAVNRLDLLATLLSRLDHWTAELDAEALFGAWQRRLSALGKRVIVYPARGEPYAAYAEAVDSLGALVVRADDGQSHYLLAADVSLAEAE
jgi:BirA family biotin operon repressor/biotin-[acetyl-CoA-carboxylase] ligase